MISGLVPFESIIESLKDETGFTNTRPIYDRIRRLIFRAEREIGYGGSVVLKKMVFTKDVNFNGKFIPYPADFIELEGVGHCCKPLCESEYGFTPDGIRLRTTKQKCVLLYWAIFCDGQGNPVVTRNHEEAVVAYIKWKLYAQKTFMGEGNFNMQKDYELSFYSLCGEARGDDAMPTLEQWNEIGLLTYSDRRGLLQQWTSSYSYCEDEILPPQCLPITPETMKVYYFQRTHFEETIDQLSENINALFLSTKPVQAFEVFEQGYMVDNAEIGRLAFVIQETEIQDFALVDALNNDVTDDFESVYIPDQRAMLFRSKNILSHSTIYFKFKKILNNA